MSKETSNTHVMLEEAMNMAEDSKELFTQHVQRALTEKFVPRNNAVVSEKLSEMDSEEEDEEAYEKEVSELYVSDEDPDSEKLDETNVEEDMVPTLEPDATDQSVTMEPEVEPEMGIDKQDIIDALKELLGIKLEPEMDPDLERGLDPADEIEPGINQEQEEVEENASPTQDMDAPKQNEPNSEMGTVKKSSPDAEQKKMNEEDTVSEEEDSLEIVEDEEVNNNLSETNSVSKYAFDQLQGKVITLENKNKTLSNENEQLKQAIGIYNKTLTEQKRDLTKLQYLNTIFDKYPINAQTRQRIIEKFDSAKSENDIKIYFESFTEAFDINNVAPKSKIQIKESAKHIGNQTVKKNITEGKGDQFAKFKSILNYSLGD